VNGAQPCLERSPVSSSPSSRLLAKHGGQRDGVEVMHD
jgi:hypothetical protein